MVSGIFMEALRWDLWSVSGGFGEDKRDGLLGLKTPGDLRRIRGRFRGIHGGFTADFGRH
jgi:hypothetical protein